MSNKQTLILGSFTYITLLIFALVFYQERVIFSDVAYILFKLITEGDWAIQVLRFVSFFTQSFGLAASKVGLPLKWVAIFHSAGFIMYYYVIFLILLIPLKNKSLALGLILFNTLMVTYSFYWIPSELIQGIAFVLIYIALLEKIIKKEKTSYLLYFISFLCLITCVFAHPLIIFALIFGILYLALNKKQCYVFLGINLVLVIVIYLLKSKLLPNAYDSEAMKGISKLSPILSRFNLIFFKSFFQQLASDYIFLSLGFIIISIYYLSTKQILKFLIFIASFVGYSILVNIAHANVKPQWYIESQYLILSFFVILPIVTEVLPHFNRKITLSILCLTITISLIRIYKAHIPFFTKLEWQRNYLKKTKEYENPKIIINQDLMPMDTLLEHWGSAYEFWLLSTIETGETRSILINRNKEEIARLLKWKDKKAFFGKWDGIQYEKLNPRYFMFKDTVHYYEMRSSK